MVRNADNPIDFLIPYLTGIVWYPPFLSPFMSLIAPTRLLFASWNKKTGARSQMYIGIASNATGAVKTPYKYAATVTTPLLYDQGILLILLLMYR